MSGLFVLVSFLANASEGNLYQAEVSVSGLVTSGEDGSELPGVTVLEKGTTNGTITDMNGKYTLQVSEGATLVFTSIGFLEQEQTVGSQSVIDVQMQTDVKELETVVVIGYGTSKKSDLTGSVASIDNEALQKIPSSRVDQVLQGRAAGVQITSVSGAPGAGTVIRVRGGNSIEGSNQPLWVIDGIIVGQDFNLNNLNTNDIRSIEVLKDASSIAIYGSRGANGVVLVTTKSGMATGGKPQVSVGLYTSTQLVPERPAFLNKEEQIEYTNEDAAYRGVALPFPDDPSTYEDNDYFNMLLDPSPIYNADVSISGSSENGNVNYYNSLNYFNQDGLIKNSGIEKFIFRSNLDIKLTDRWKTGFRMNFSRIKQDNGTVGYGGLLNILPTQPVYNDDGTYNGWNEVIGAPFSNPVANAELNTNETQINNVLATAYLEFKPTPKWMIRSTFSPEIDNTKRNRFNSSQSPDRLVVNQGGDAEVRATTSIGWNNENTIQYSTEFGDHSITGLVGASFQHFQAESVSAEAYGFTSDAVGYNSLGLGSDPTRNIVNSSFDEFSIVSFFGRLNYSFRDKYLLTLVARTDGSSRFAEGNKYELYPSVAGAWKVSNEPFMQDVTFINNLKLRASYGRSGSQGIESYRTLALLTEASTTYGGVQNPGLTLGRPANPALQWETTDQLDLAVETSMFNNRVFAEFGFYRKETNDLLLEVVVPRQTGFSSQLQNIGSLENKGWEFLLKTTNVSHGDFDWGSTLTLSSNKNKVLDLGGQEFIDVVIDEILGSGNTRIIVGEPVPVFTGVKYLGTYKTQEEIDNSGMNVIPELGSSKFQDLNGDGNITNEDNIVLGSPQPDLVFGLENSITYKNFNLSFFFQGTYGNEVYNLRMRPNYFTRGENPKFAEIADRWTPQNPTSDIPRAGAASESTNSNSEMVEDGSHIRLKTLRLTYNLPTNQWGWNNIDRMSVYFSGTNLWLLSDFRLIDPETSNFGNSGLGNIAQGYSSGEYPNAKVLTLGLNLTF
ncbi:SusC/RagA family TonB-linked outer membrane protein [Reichenbachiella ulvae]|uniref:TonB-dependent receptor n=1 Tax=Reichenbachiella ulvae TaxID=2980104 RepID=A0ABT3CST5_9BACT|nr:TonB-dependent receptor [Reichenbachiella ulvae]MCV9386687.1 TonB-dependent receptor [Reichenbachiella ulvae]